MKRRGSYVSLTIFAGLAIGVASFVAGRYTVTDKPATVEVREVVKHVVVTRTVERKPDGTTIETEITDKKDQVGTVAGTAASPQPKWRVSGGIGVNRDLDPAYMLHIEKRVAGPLSVGAWLVTSPAAKAAGVSASIEF